MVKYLNRIFSIKQGSKDLLNPSYFPSFLWAVVMLALSLLSLLLATTGFAAPHHRRGSVPASALKVPSNQTQLVVPTSAPKYVAVGVGNQNYSCTAGGSYS